MNITSMSVLLIVGPKCTLAARCMLPPGESQCICRRYRRTDGRTLDRYFTFFARKLSVKSSWVFELHHGDCTVQTTEENIFAWFPAVFNVYIRSMFLASSLVTTNASFGLAQTCILGPTAVSQHLGLFANSGILPHYTQLHYTVRISNRRP